MAEVHEGGSRPRQTVAIFLVSLAGLLLEVGYTRIVSYKLWYYYTYLVIGLALLGIGSGGVFVAVFTPIGAGRPSAIIAVCSSPARSASRRLPRHRADPVDTLAIWDYGTRASFKNLAFARRHLLRDLRDVHRVRRSSSRRSSDGRGDGVGRLYFADLVGAGLGCLLAIPLITRLGPAARDHARRR